LNDRSDGPVGIDRLTGIGEAAARFGLPVSTLRYWEERGLVSPPRRHGTWRRYGAEELHRIGLIQLWRDAGMLSLDEIAAVLAGSDRDRDWHTAVAHRLTLLTEQQRRLAAAVDHLEHLLSCPDEHPAERCPHLRRVTSERLAAAADRAVRG
jgi:MerR family copper efflux transcriptional regulator